MQFYQKTEDNKEDDESDDDISCCNELKYSVKRLVKGLASTRKGARQGFATVLTEILSEFACLSPEKVLKLIAKNLEVTGSAKSWVRHWSSKKREELVSGQDNRQGEVRVDWKMKFCFLIL